LENRTIWIKKLIYRSKYTGTKETDLLLGNFAENYLTKLNDDQLMNYEKLLVSGDPRIWRLSIDVEKTDNEKEKNIISLIQEFKGF
jgi:antitoxin CptB|tara:strand:- start:539 stop:796 length:258 start_codon:yes stop_codon:yes gene_type:complete